LIADNQRTLPLSTMSAYNRNS